MDTKHDAYVSHTYVSTVGRCGCIAFCLTMYNIAASLYNRLQVSNLYTFGRISCTLLSFFLYSRRPGYCKKKCSCTSRGPQHEPRKAYYGHNPWPKDPQGPMRPRSGSKLQENYSHELFPVGRLSCIPKLAQPIS